MTDNVPPHVTDNAARTLPQTGTRMFIIGGVIYEQTFLILEGQ